MAYGTWFPPVFDAVREAVPGVPVYEYLPEQPMEVPAILFEPPSVQGSWPREASGSQEWTWELKVYCLFSRGGQVLGSADQQVRSWIEPIRRSVSALFRPGWPPSDPEDPEHRAAVTKSGFLRAEPTVIEWGGVTYLALLYVHRVVEKVFDPGLP